jgi:hypothetical protein
MTVKAISRKANRGRKHCAGYEVVIPNITDFGRKRKSYGKRGHEQGDLRIAFFILCYCLRFHLYISGQFSLLISAVYLYYASHISILIAGSFSSVIIEMSSVAIWLYLYLIGHLMPFVLFSP